MMRAVHPFRPADVYSHDHDGNGKIEQSGRGARRRVQPPQRTVHPLYVRITHWINALAVLIMIGSGWQIYNASPLFAFTFPKGITLGGWLAGGLLWHFAAMWLLIVNGLVYVTLGLATGRFRRKTAADPAGRGRARSRRRADRPAQARRPCPLQCRAEAALCRAFC